MKKPAKTTGDAQRPAVLSSDDIKAIATGTHTDPFAVLGVQRTSDGFIARCFIPGAETVTAETLAGKEIGTLERRDEAGFFEGAIERMSRDRGLHETLVQQRGPVTTSPFRETLIESIEELFQRAQRSGVIRPDAVPTDVAPIFAMMGVAIDMATVGGPGEPGFWTPRPLFWRRHH